MGARTSAELLQALELIRAGASPQRAAAQTGLHPSTISRSRHYRDWLASRAAPPGAPHAPDHGTA